MKRLTVKTGVYQDDGHREVAGMKCGVELKDIFDRLAAIEDILGDEYDLDRLRELTQADQVGHCIVFDLHYPVVSEYYKDEDGLFIREASGVISKEEYEAALRREQNGQGG